MLNLTKGKPALNLTKSQPNKTKYVVGLAWDTDADFDASVVVLNKGVRSDLVYYSNLTAIGVTHRGDVTDGTTVEGDDETIDIDLAAVKGDEIVVTITSYNSGTFGEADNTVANLYNHGESKPLISANLASEAAFGTALTLIRFFKEAGEWQFENISETVGISANGLEDIIAKYK